MQQGDIITLAITIGFTTAVLSTTAYFAIKLILEKRKERLKEPELFI